MSNSSLVVYKKLSPNYTKMTDKKNTDIVIHHMAGKLSVETCGKIFANSDRRASSNYGIGNDGRIALYVKESNRSWATSNAALDRRAVTIEVANSAVGGDWPVSDKAMTSLINLCVDICQRNGIKKLNYTGDKTGNLHMHCWYAATACPGPYLKDKFAYIADEVNKKLEAATKKSTETSTKTTTKTTTKKSVKATGAAYEFKESYAGTYVTTTALHLRNGAGKKQKSLIVLPKGIKVQCYGYYSIVDKTDKWMYVQVTINGVQYTGFSNKDFLKKV